MIVNGPAGSGTRLFLYSPDFRPDAKSENRIARFVTVGNSLLDPSSIYNTTTSTFMLALNSEGAPIEIVFNFDLGQNYYLSGLVQSLGLFYALVLLPFAIVGLHKGIRRLTRSR
jgi:hypothetical protein